MDKYSKLRGMIRSIVKELQDEKDLEEITTTSNVAGYNTPSAFKKSDGRDTDAKPDNDYIDRINSGTGYTRVNETKLNERLEGRNVKVNIGSDNKPKWVRGTVSMEYGTRITVDISPKRDTSKLISVSKGDLMNKNKIIFESKLNENRWLDLKKSEGTPNKKIGEGIRNIRRQIQEIEKFVEWYSKIKSESGLSSDALWKRTNKHLAVIRERLNKLSQKITELSS